MTMQEARDALGKSDDVTDDRRIAKLIPMAYRAIERKLNKAIFTQTRIAKFEVFPGRIRLDYPPLASVTHVKYYNTANSLTTFSSGSYIVDINQTWGVIQLVEGSSWPQVYTRSDAIEVEFVCGKAVGSVEGQETIKEAIFQELWGLFFKDDMRKEVDDLIHNYKVVAL